MKSKIILALIIILAVSFIVGIIFAITIAANRIDESITTDETTQPTEEVFTLFSTEATGEYIFPRTARSFCPMPDR